MATSAVPRGLTIDALTKSQSSFSTLPSGNWTKTFIYSHTLEEKNPFEDDPLLGQARTNDRDQLAPASGLPTMSGQIVVPVDYNHLGLWLRYLMGAGSDTGSADPYTHVWNSGAEAIPIWAFEVGIKNVGGSTKFFDYMGCIGSKMTLEMSRAAGDQKMTIDVMGRSEGKNSSSQGGTPAAVWARDPVKASVGVLNIGGSLAANILKVQAVYDNKPTAQDFLNGTPYPSGFDLDDEATFTGSIDVRFLDTTMYDHAVAGDVLDAVMGFNIGGDHALTFEAAALRLERSGAPISGPGGIQQTFNFRAEQNASGPMLVTTLSNLVASYNSM